MRRHEYLLAGSGSHGGMNPDVYWFHQADGREHARTIFEYVEIWRRVPLEDGILSAPPVPDLAKDYQPPQQGAGLDTVVQFVSNCHASLPHAPISVAEYWQTMLPTSCTIPAGGELLPDYGEVTFDATSMIARCDFIP